ncbi:MAG TPA: chaperone NapD [Thermodesulfovibrionales bacterium]|jgi:nitrate reductase NapAB chaperone NapD|nr:chaperone NapD [Thermodesulfovibrionales bacterium]
MPVAGAVVDIQEGSSEAVLKSLALIDNVSVYGVKNNRIVAVIEDAGMPGMEETITRIYAIEHVIGIYPVYAGGYEGP